MPVSIREQLLAAITTAVGGEYAVPEPDSEKDLPVCSVLDGDEVATPDEYGHDTIEMPVVVTRISASSAPDPTTMRTEANELLARIRQDMFTDETFDGLALGVEYVTGGISTEAAKQVEAEAGFSVRYQTVRGDPYTINAD